MLLRRSLLGIGLVCLLLALPARAQTGEDVLRYTQRFPAVGARMAGMAGAAVGGVADWGGVYANPAGLGFARRSQVSGALSIVSTQDEALYFGEAMDSEATSLALGSAAYIAKVPTRRGSLVFGVGYDQQGIFDRDLAFVGTNPNAYDPDVPGSGPLRQYGQVLEEGQRGTLSFAGAVEVAPRVMTGLTLNLSSGSYEFQQQLDEEDLSGRLIFQTDDFLRADLRGANLRAGLAAEVSPGVRVGAAVETPTVLRVEEVFVLEGPSESFDYTVTTPWRIAGGIAYEQAGFLLTADVEYADWSQARLRPTRDFLDANLDIRSTYRETFDTRFGAEYDFGVGTARIGAAFQPDPLRDEVQVNRIRDTYTLGLSLRAGAATFDLAYLFTEFEDQLVPYSFPDDTPVVDEEVRRHQFLVGVRVDL